MAEDILSKYGPDYNAPKQSPGSSGLTTDGGKPYVKPCNYAQPGGPINQGNEGPGLLGGTNTGNNNMAPTHDNDGGRPGLSGINHGNKGSQGSY